MLERTAIGSVRVDGGMRRVAATLDPDTFEQVRLRAVREGMSFAAQIRLLVEWGLMADDQR